MWFLSCEIEIAQHLLRVPYNGGEHVRQIELHSYASGSRISLHGYEFMTDNFETVRFRKRVSEITMIRGAHEGEEEALGGAVKVKAKTNSL